MTARLNASSAKSKSLSGPPICPIRKPEILPAAIGLWEAAWCGGDGAGVAAGVGLAVDT